IFGAQMITLVKAQLFINIVGGLAFRWILRSVQVPVTIRFIGVLVFCLSYSLPNYWPWYNHSVIFYELIALGFLLHFLQKDPEAFRPRWILILPALAGAFVFFSFFTKQDG